MLHLAHGLDFADLYDDTALQRLDALFLNALYAGDAELATRLSHARKEKAFHNGPEASALLLALAPHVEDFIGELFAIRAEVVALGGRHQQLAPLFACKRQFVQRRVGKGKPPEVFLSDAQEVRSELETAFNEPFSELAFARHVLAWLDDPESAAKVHLAETYAAWALFTDAGKACHRDGVLFKLPHKVDLEHLVPCVRVPFHGAAALELPESSLRAREGFTLTDAGGNLAYALDQANYCIWCHHQGKDSCSKGLKEKDGTFKKSTQNVTLHGCPLEEKNFRNA